MNLLLAWPLYVEHAPTIDEHDENFIVSFPTGDEVLRVALSHRLFRSLRISAAQAHDEFIARRTAAAAMILPHPAAPPGPTGRRGRSRKGD